MSGGYGHILLPNGLVQFKTDVTNSDSSLIPLVSECPSWYNKCISAAPDYAADDGGSKTEGDVWCEDKCDFSCTKCDLEFGASRRHLHSGVLSGVIGLAEMERSTCTDICDQILAGSRAATASIRSLVAAAGLAAAKYLC